MSAMKETAEKIAAGVAEGYEKIENGVVTSYQKIEDGVVEGFGKITHKLTHTFHNEDGTIKTDDLGGKVVDGYKKVEEGVVGGFNKLADKFVDTFLTKEGETLEEARARIAADRKAREEQQKVEAETRKAAQKEMIEKSLEASRSAGKRN